MMYHQQLGSTGHHHWWCGTRFEDEIMTDAAFSNGSVVDQHPLESKQAVQQVIPTIQ